MAYDRLLYGVDNCRGLNDYIRDITETSTFPELSELVNRYFEVDCYNTSTYIFEPNVTTFSSQTCTHLFTSTNLGTSVDMSVLIDTINHDTHA